MECEGMNPGNAFVAYINACQFESAAKELNGMNNSSDAPIVVIAAFACELFLKSLLLLQDKNSCYKDHNLKVHNLKVLFNLLNKNMRNTIKVNAGIASWDRFLDESKEAFIVWRYAYQYLLDKEYLIISIKDLLRFAHALHEEAERHFGKFGGLSELSEDAFEEGKEDWYADE